MKALRGKSENIAEMHVVREEEESSAARGIQNLHVAAASKPGLLSRQPFVP